MSVRCSGCSRAFGLQQEDIRNARADVEPGSFDLARIGFARMGSGKRGSSPTVVLARLSALLPDLDRARVAGRAGAALIALAVGGAIGVGVVSRFGPDGMRVAAVFVALGGLLLAIRADRWLWAAVVMLASWWLAVIAARYVPDLVNPAPPVGQAVGAAAFADTPYRGAQIGAALSVAAPAAVALVAVLLGKRRAGVQRPAQRAVTSRGAAGGEDGGAGEDPHRRLRRALSSRRWLWAGAVILAFTLVPDIRAYVRGAGTPIPYSWDTSTVLAWQGFVQMGLVPMRDFFYPYGFQWLYTMGNFGPLYEWLAQALMLAAAGWSLWRLSGGRAWRVLACLVVVILLGPWTETWRYFPALLVPVTYAALSPAQHGRLTVGHLIFFAVCVLAVLIEPDLLGIGVVGAALVVVGELVAERIPWSPRRLAIGLGLDSLPVLGAVGVAVLVWLLTGTVGGNLRFYTQLTAVSAASASNERLQGPLGLMVLHPNAYSLYAAAPALLAALGLLWARVQSHDRPEIAPILLSASGVALVLLLKHFVRAIGDEVLIPAFVALAWAGILAWRPRSVLSAAACAAVLAAVFTMTDHTGGLSPAQYIRSALEAPTRAARSIGVAFDVRARIRAAGARYSAERFTSWPDSAVANDYLSVVRSRSWPPPRFAIIGDSQMTYVLLGQRPPYESEMYDAAVLSEQRAMLSSLERRPPPYVIWRRDFCQDGLPYQVRDPLVFQWMIAHYTPIRIFAGDAAPNATTCGAINAVGTVVVLRRLEPTEKRPVAFWRSQFTTTEDLGYLPSLSAGLGAPRCSRGTGCAAYALITAPRRSDAGAITVKVIGAGGPYTVSLSSRSGASRYAVRLDRLWFWPFVNGHVRVAMQTAGFGVRLVRLRSGDNLY